MDCTVCNLRSSVGFCAECQTLLCEECGAVCDECSKRICPLHVHETRHGRTLCTPCHNEYNERHRRRDAEGLDVADAHARRGRLDRSGHQPVRPWLASLYLAVLGAIGIVVLLAFPNLRQVDIGLGRPITMAFIVVVLPFLAVAWAFLGLFTRWSRDAKSLNFIGFSIAAVTIVLSFFAVRPPAGSALLELPPEGELTEAQRANLTPEQLEQWRQNMLERYQGENAPPPPPKRNINLDEIAPPPTGQR